MTETELIATVRKGLARAGSIREIKMFGGIGFMLNENMVVAASKRGLLARVGKDGEAAALELPGARVMEMSGRRMAGYIRIDLSSLSDEAVRASLRLAIPYVQGLPAKTVRTKKASEKAGASKPGSGMPSGKRGAVKKPTAKKARKPSAKKKSS